MQKSFLTQNTSLGSRAVGCSLRLSSSRFAAKYAVKVHSDASGKLMKKPELKKPEKLENKRLFDDSTETLLSESKPIEELVPPEAPKASGVTIEYQRQQAKAMVKYFQELSSTTKIEQSKILGWTPNNEITNGRWVMFGLLVGTLTEYATGVDFIRQLRLIVSNLGILDLD